MLPRVSGRVVRDFSAGFSFWVEWELSEALY